MVSEMGAGGEGGVGEKESFSPLLPTPLFSFSLFLNIIYFLSSLLLTQLEKKAQRKGP